MAALIYRARWLIGRGWRVGLALALLTGLVAGLVGSAWAAGRRGEDSYRRFVDHVGAPGYYGFFCDPAHPMIQNGIFPRCATDYDPVAESAFLRGLPGVVSVTKTRYIPVDITVDGQTFAAAISVSYDGPLINSAGNPIVVARPPAAETRRTVRERGGGAVSAGRADHDPPHVGRDRQAARPTDPDAAPRGHRPLPRRSGGAGEQARAGDGHRLRRAVVVGRMGQQGRELEPGRPRPASPRRHRRLDPRRRRRPLARSVRVRPAVRATRRRARSATPSGTSRTP